MKYLILGDIHGSFSALHSTIKFCKRIFNIDGVIQLGDLGVYPQCFKYLKVHKNQYKDFPFYFVDGNHEDHVFLNSLNHSKLKSNYNIHWMRRGSICTLNNMKIGWIGGAFNADRPQENIVENNKNITNYPTIDEINVSINNFNSEKPDIIISHGCPGGIGIGIKGCDFLIPTVQEFIVKAGFKNYPIDDIGEEPLTTLWHQLTYKPKYWIFGHYHQTRDAKIGKTNFIGLNMYDHSPYLGSYYWFLDTEKGEVSVEVIKNEYFQI